MSTLNQFGNVELEVATLRARLAELEQEKEALVHERKLMRTLMENSVDVIFFKDRQSRFIAGSSSLMRRFEISSLKQLIGKNDFDFFSEELARAAYSDE